MPLLGVNIDHVATVRQARMTNEPDPVHAAVLAEMGGADGITVHGLDIVGQKDRVAECVKRLQDVGVRVSLFVDPDEWQIAASAEVGADAIEIHTGTWADAQSAETRASEYARILKGSQQATEADLQLNMGHGLTYRNVRDIATIPNVHELNIGHSIISHAVMVGLERAVREMKQLITV